MERKINSTFKYKGKIYIVKAQPHCDNCAFDSICNSETLYITGNCSGLIRSDHTEVSFVELSKEETMENVEISKENILKAAKENPCAEKVLKDLFPKVFEEEENKPFCKIGSIFKRKSCPNSIYTVFKWDGQVGILNITYNHIWNIRKNLNVAYLKDPKEQTLTVAEFKKLIGEKPLEDFNFNVEVIEK